MMRYLLILILGVTLFSFANSEVETLKAENEALRLAVHEQTNRAEEAELVAVNAAAIAKESEAKAVLVMKQAVDEKKRADAAAERALKALKDSKGK